MIRPVQFHSNPLTAASNRFQGKTEQSADEQQSAAAREFDGLASVLRDNGITVVDIDDTSEPPTPDSVFPNNWISTHADGTVVLYPMEAENRRTERRLDIVETLSSRLRDTRCPASSTYRRTNEEGDTSRAPEAWCSTARTGSPTRASRRARTSTRWATSRSSSTTRWLRSMPSIATACRSTIPT